MRARGRASGLLVLRDGQVLQMVMRPRQPTPRDSTRHLEMVKMGLFVCLFVCFTTMKNYFLKFQGWHHQERAMLGGEGMTVTTARLKCGAQGRSEGLDWDFAHERTQRSQRRDAAPRPTAWKPAMGPASRQEPQSSKDYRPLRLCLSLSLRVCPLPKISLLFPCLS